MIHYFVVVFGVGSVLLPTVTAYVARTFTFVDLLHHPTSLTLGSQESCNRRLAFELVPQRKQVVQRLLCGAAFLPK